MATHLAECSSGDGPDRVQQAAADVLGLEGMVALAVSTVAIAQPTAVFRRLLRLSFHLVHFAEAAGNRVALEADLGIAGAIDVAHEHVDGGVVATVGHGEHFIEAAGARDERQETPEGASPQRRAANALKVPGPADFDHAHTRSDVDQQVGIYRGTRGEEGHGRLGRVREDLIGDFANEEIQALEFLVRVSRVQRRGRLTDDQAFHLVFSDDLDTQLTLDVLVEFEGPAARGHDREVSGPAPVESSVSGL